LGDLGDEPDGKRISDSKCLKISTCEKLLLVDENRKENIETSLLNSTFLVWTELSQFLKKSVFQPYRFLQPSVCFVII